MATSRPRFVINAPIWIDLHFGELLAKIFTLPCEWITTDFVFAELKSLDKESLIPLGLKVVELTGDQVTLLAALIERYRKPSFADLTAFFYAQFHRLMLFTGDNALRKAAENEGIEVHGVLWLLDELIAHRIISPAEAARSLKLMIENGARLPQSECEKRFRAWKKA